MEGATTKKREHTNKQTKNIWRNWTYTPLFVLKQTTEKNGKHNKTIVTRTTVDDQRVWCFIDTYAASSFSKG